MTDDKICTNCGKKVIRFMYSAPLCSECIEELEKPMTEELKMPLPEEAMVLETRMVVISLELPKFVWWALDMAERSTNTSTSESFANTIKADLVKRAKIASQIADLLP